MPLYAMPATCEIAKNPLLHEIASRPILPLINRTRMEELSKLHDEKRRIESRLMELEGRS
jgi:hypothetical protein